MNCEEYIAKMKDIQKSFLNFLSHEDNIEENYENLIKLIIDNKINDDENEFRLFLHLIDSVSNNHFRSNGFFDKIEQILLYFKEEYNKYLTNSEIFNIFRDNKLVLYILFQNKILVCDNYITNCFLKFKKKKLPNYFINEIKPFITEKIYKDLEAENQKEEDGSIEPEIFEKNRRKGENQTKICQLIRKDDIDEFITYISQNDISLQTQIKPSIFETNILLNYKNPSLIEYAAFFGSIQIFRYLYLNGEKPKPHLWIYAIHGDNPELIVFLEEKQFEMDEKNLNFFLVETVRFHHNDITNYLKENYMKEQIDDEIGIKSIEFYNFEFFPENFFYRQIFFHLCEFDYFFIVFQILKNQNFEVDFIIKDTSLGYEDVTTPFLSSIWRDNTNIARILLNHQKIDLNFKSTRCKWSKFDENQNALQIATVNNNEKIVALLLENDTIDLNMTMMQRIYKPNNSFQIIESIPLFEALSNKSTKIIQLFVENPKSDLNIQKKNYNHCLNQNFHTVDPKALKLISLLHFAVFLDDENIIKILLSNPNIDTHMKSVIITSTLEHKETALYFATRTYNLKIVKILASDSKIDINQKSYVKKNVKEKKETSLHCAISNCDVEISRVFIFHPKIEINMKAEMRDKSGIFIESKASSLIIAIRKKQYDIIKDLLNNPNIDVNTIYEYKTNISYDEKSPLFLAVELEDEKIVEILLSHPKIDVNYTSISNVNDASKLSKTSVLCMAIIKQNLKIIELLLKMPKIDVNLKSYLKKNEVNSIEEIEELPINYAIEKDDIDIVKLLISNPGIDLSLKSNRSIFSPTGYFNEEKTPIQKAILLKNTNIIAFLFQNLSVNDSAKIDFNQLINLTDDEKIKAVIYKGINRLNLK